MVKIVNITKIAGRGNLIKLPQATEKIEGAMAILPVGVMGRGVFPSATQTSYVPPQC